MKQLDESLFPCSPGLDGSDAQRNAIYYVPVNPFIFKQPAVPKHCFENERLELLSDRSTNRIIALDLSAQMELPYPATTPNMLSRYITIGKGDNLSLNLNAVVNIYYVMEGRGHSACGDTCIAWKTGDVFIFPGGTATSHLASDEGAALYLVTDEPMLSFAGTRATDNKDAKVAATLFLSDEINLHLERTYARSKSGVEAAKSVWFTSKQMESLRTTSPNITANLNTLAAGDDQRTHRHNAAAITLSIAGDGVYSVVDGERSDWYPFSVMVTPPGALHSHHNRGSNTMRSFVVQDSGLHYYSRTTGFHFDH